jgi:hypothetical protein
MRIKFLFLFVFRPDILLENIISMRKKNKHYFSYSSEFLDIEIVEYLVIDTQKLAKS